MASNGTTRRSGALLNFSVTVELLFIDFQIPELELQHDRHFLRIPVAQAVGHFHLRMIGAEGDIEMMVARQACRRDRGQHAANDAAQGIFNNDIVAHQIFGHSLIAASKN